MYSVCYAEQNMRTTTEEDLFQFVMHKLYNMPFT